jgi:hypothetical protein
MDPERASWGIISIHSEESRFDFFPRLRLVDIFHQSPVPRQP